MRGKRCVKTTTARVNTFVNKGWLKSKIII